MRPGLSGSNISARPAEPARPEIALQIITLPCLEMFNYRERSVFQRSRRRRGGPSGPQRRGCGRVLSAGFHPNYTRFSSKDVSPSSSVCLRHRAVCNTCMFTRGSRKSSGTSAPQLCCASKVILTTHSCAKSKKLATPFTRAFGIGSSEHQPFIILFSR